MTIFADYPAQTFTQSGVSERRDGHFSFWIQEKAVRQNQSGKVIRGVIDPFIWAASLLKVGGLDLNLCL